MICIVSIFLAYSVHAQDNYLINEIADICDMDTAQVRLIGIDKLSRTERILLLNAINQAIDGHDSQQPINQSHDEVQKTYALILKRLNEMEIEYTDVDEAIGLAFVFNIIKETASETRKSLENDSDWLYGHGEGSKIRWEYGHGEGTKDENDEHRYSFGTR